MVRDGSGIRQIRQSGLPRVNMFNVHIVASLEKYGRTRLHHDYFQLIQSGKAPSSLLDLIIRISNLFMLSNWAFLAYVGVSNSINEGVVYEILINHSNGSKIPTADLKKNYKIFIVKYIMFRKLYLFYFITYFYLLANNLKSTNKWVLLKKSFSLDPICFGKQGKKHRD